jgi:hypothetical protein
MVARLEVAVAVTKSSVMKVFAGAIVLILVSQATILAQTDSTQVYKKRVLESTEIDFLTSYYTQEGQNAAVTGGIGTEELTDSMTMMCYLLMQVFLPTPLLLRVT